MKPTASIKHRRDEQLNRVKENSARNTNKEVIDHVLDRMEGHEVRRHSMDFIYVEALPWGKKGCSYRHRGRCLSDHEGNGRKSRPMTSTPNAHSAARPCLHTHAGHRRRTFKRL